MLDSVLGRIVAPTGAVGFALFAEQRALGLFNRVALPVWLELLLALFLLDLAIYLQHRLFHYVPVLWRLHRMHHRSEEHTSELQSPYDVVCRLLLQKKQRVFALPRLRRRLPVR